MNRRGLAHEIGEGHFNIAGIRFELIDHGPHHALERLDGQFLIMAIEYFRKPGHMRAPGLMG